MLTTVLEKISSYNLLNYLLPGILYISFANRYANLAISTENLWEFLFIAYFLGLTISRIGSTVIAPAIKKLPCHPKECKYKDFLSASQNDPKIELLSSERSVFRNIIALGITLLTTILAHKAIKVLHLSELSSFAIITSIIIMLYIAAYIKQTKFIIKRINKNKNKKQ